MRRRHVLAATASATALPLAGCAGLRSRTIDLGRPRETVEADGAEKHLIFSRDGTEQAILTIQQRRRPAVPEQSLPIRLVVWHRQGLSIDRLAFKLRAPPTGGGVPADIYLKVPGSGPWPPFDLQQANGLWSVISVDDIGDLGDGTLGLELVVDPISDPIETLAVRFEGELSRQALLGRDFEASANTQFDVVYAEQ